MRINGAPIVVVGSGVAGLSAAYCLVKDGYKVTILAKEMPGDHNIMFTSDWAGAGLGFIAGLEGIPRRVNKESFETMWKLSGEYPHCGITRVTVETYYDKTPDESKLWYKKLATGFRVLNKSEYPSQYEYGITYEAMTADPPIYLPWLTSQVRALGVNIRRATLSSLADALTYVPNATAIINCSGIGARYLTDVKDTAVFPDRGQTCVIRTSFKKMITRAGAEYTYLIPRPQSGLLILGGINEHWNTSPEPNPATRQMFKERAYKICPELGPPDKMVFDRDIVGVRSTRTGGYRLEREQKAGLPPIVHSYGYSGGGYQASMGAALQVVRLVKGEE